ncbi:MAG: glycosyl hydrolase [Gammaproteobacteria bacterium RIFCSPLOWO2_02_FULL_61_13]|nr:MAG: glycosyl hydrolase [Gammaproteobacteria bacterium RIFCSPLOWO2_02_FULL_61_13]
MPSPAPLTPDVRLIAFYLPQFHPIPENDAWWGKGFTEWTSVVQACPLFPGHYQPHLPADLGFYDLRVAESRTAQAELAREYGVYGFCYYHYWFAGKRLLERPLNDVLRLGQPQFPFCICWANETWTRRWDGSNNEILIEQKHDAATDAAFMHDLLPYLADPRYIRIHGRPLVLVYRIDLFPEPQRTAALWRDIAINAGVGDPYLVQVESFSITGDPMANGFDAAVEFPGHQIPKAAVMNVDPGVPTFKGRKFDYLTYARFMARRPDPAYRRFRSVMPAWDNTARMRERAGLFVGSSPEIYQAWLREAVGRTRNKAAGDERVVFINAWNEWGEGCHLEPDLHYGRQYLEATRAALIVGN